MRSRGTRAWSNLGAGLLSAILLIVLSGCGALPATSEANKGAAVDSDLVQSLQRQIKERDKRIAELTSQLEALRIIEQDLEKGKKSIHPTLTPTERDLRR